MDPGERRVGVDRQLRQVNSTQCNYVKKRCFHVGVADGMSEHLSLKATDEYSHLIAMSVVCPGYATTLPPPSPHLHNWSGHQKACQ